MAKQEVRLSETMLADNRANRKKINREAQKLRTMKNKEKRKEKEKLKQYGDACARFGCYEPFKITWAARAAELRKKNMQAQFGDGPLPGQQDEPAPEETKMWTFRAAQHQRWQNPLSKLRGQVPKKERFTVTYIPKPKPKATGKEFENFADLYAHVKVTAQKEEA